MHANIAYETEEPTLSVEEYNKVALRFFNKIDDRLKISILDVIIEV